MKKKLVKKYIRVKKLFFTLIISTFLFSCTSKVEREFNEALVAKDKGLYRIAASKFEGVAKKFPDDPKALEAAREAAKITHYEIKDYKRSLELYKLIVLKSNDQKERSDAQEQIAMIYFDNEQDYPKAIDEFNRLLGNSGLLQEKVKYKLMIARSFYYTGSFNQALQEIEEMLKLNPQGDERFDMLLLKANSMVAKKEHLKAISIYETLGVINSERAKAENIPSAIAVCYEELLDFKKAAEIVEEAVKIEPNNDYLALRLKRLKERSINKPGARGMRK